MAHASRTRAFFDLFCARLVRVRHKICRKRARVSAQKLRLIGGDDFAHAAKICAKFRAEIARSSAGRARVCICFACGAHAFDAKSAEKLQEIQRRSRASSPATAPQTWRKFTQIFALILHAFRDGVSPSLISLCHSFNHSNSFGNVRFEVGFRISGQC